MSDDDSITKLIIYGLGIGAILFFAYLIFKETYKPSIQQTQSLSTEQLMMMEQRLSRLESKPSVVSMKQSDTETKSDNKIVSMSNKDKYSLSPADKNRDTKRMFGML